MSHFYKAILLLLTFSLPAHARPLDAIGNCPSGTMTQADIPFKGTALDLKKIPDFLSRHAAATKEEDGWLRELSGRSGKNRLYRQREQQIIVMTICNTSACENNRAYVAYEGKTGAWGAVVYEGGHVRELGATPDDHYLAPPLSVAITCAQNLDWGQQ